MSGWRRWSRQPVASGHPAGPTAQQIPVVVTVISSPSHTKVVVAGYLPSAYLGSMLSELRRTGIDHCTIMFVYLLSR